MLIEMALVRVFVSTLFTNVVQKILQICDFMRRADYKACGIQVAGYI